jgi:hypothetical protein
MGATELSRPWEGAFPPDVPPVPGDGSSAPGRVAPGPAGAAERAARHTLRAQITRLERELSEAFVTAAQMGGVVTAPDGFRCAPRLLGLGELEQVRDDLARRLHAARAGIGCRADEQEAKRVALERMLSDPASHRFARISCRELGQNGCGVWQVRPRMGLIGMLMGWWQVKLSSGCPLAGGHAPAARPLVAR